jgi:hypothetical protein
MLDLNRAEQFFERMHVKNRQTNRPVPFRLNPSQRRIMEQCRAHTKKKRRLFIIFLKGRRLGVSTWTRRLMLAHVIEKDYAEGLIMGQQKPTARGLYEDFHKDVKQVPLKKDAWKYTQPEINFWNVQSKVTWQTAGNVVGTRGLGFTMLHASEAAYYLNPDVFPAVLSTLSDDPENMGVIETTPNGKEGPGQAYYELWEATVRGDTEFLPIFLPWHEDPDYVRDPRRVTDAPRDDYEKFLMKDLKLPRERIAFFRETLHSKCGSDLDKWRKDYPGDPEEAFSVSGDPVFNFDDLSTAKKQSRAPASFKLIELEMSTDGQKRVRAVDDRRGRFAIFETPEIGSGVHYFIGVMIGHGDRQDPDPTAWDDTLAAVVWNGETGKYAARLHCVLKQESATKLIYMLGRFFDNAMIACEDGGGGFGSRIFQELRDRWRYHNQYRWKGRNDKANPDAGARSLGFTINEYTRSMMLTTFLTAVRRGEVSVSDHEFADQMSAAQWEGGFRFEAIANSDEILYAGLVGWIAKDQWHPRQCAGYAGNADDGSFEDGLARFPHQKSPFVTQSGIVAMRLRTFEERMRARELERGQG